MEWFTTNQEHVKWDTYANWITTIQGRRFNDSSCKQTLNRASTSYGKLCFYQLYITLVNAVILDSKSERISLVDKLQFLGRGKEG